MPYSTGVETLRRNPEDQNTMLGNIAALTTKRRGQHLSTEAEANKLCKQLAFSFLLLVSLALFATGGSYLLSQSGANSSRDALVEVYDTGVQAWTDSYREDFQHGAFSVKIKYFGVREPRFGSGETLEMERDTVQDYINTEETRHDDLLHYTALKFRKDFPFESLSANEKSEATNLTRHSNFLVVPQEWLKEPIPKSRPSFDEATTIPGDSDVVVENGMSGNGVSDQDSGLRVHEPSILAMYPWVETVTNMTVTVSLRNEEGVETLVSLNDIPLGLAQMTSNNYKSCRPRGGIHQTAAAGHHCTIVLSASRICLVAHRDSRNQWQVDMDKQTNCQRPCVHPCRTSFNGTVQYLPQRTADLALAAVRGKTPFEVVVRSAHDPFLEAISLTNGTLSFGPSGRDMKTEGIICIVFGFVLGLPAIVHFLVEYSEARRAMKYECYVDSNQPVDVDSPYDSLHEVQSVNLRDIGRERDGAVRTRSSPMHTNGVGIAN